MKGPALRSEGYHAKRPLGPRHPGLGTMARNRTGRQTRRFSARRWVHMTAPAVDTDLESYGRKELLSLSLRPVRPARKCSATNSLDLRDLLEPQPDSPHSTRWSNDFVEDLTPLHRRRCGVRTSHAESTPSRHSPHEDPESEPEPFTPMPPAARPSERRLRATAGSSLGEGVIRPTPPTPRRLHLPERLSPPEEPLHRLAENFQFCYRSASTCGTGRRRSTERVAADGQPLRPCAPSRETLRPAATAPTTIPPPAPTGRRKSTKTSNS